MINYSDIASYRYDASGLRTSKTTGEITTNYCYNNGALLAQDNGNVLFFDYGIDGINGFTYQGVGNYRYKKNVLGDILGIIDDNNEEIVRYHYDAYGNQKIYVLDNESYVDISKTINYTTSGENNKFIAKLNPFRYRGYYYDEETNLYYLISRYYDPETGRFISQDKINYLAPYTINGLNLYCYCGNNPVNKYDTTGHFWESLWNGVGNWFSDYLEKVVIGTTLIVGGALVTALTAGSGVAFMAALGSALLSSMIQVGISVGTSVLVVGLVSVANGKRFFDNVGNTIANAYMWGGIFSGGAQILGGGFRMAANKGVTTGRTGGIKLTNSGVKILSPDKNNWSKAGGTLIKFGNAFRIDTGAMWGLHMHILTSGHLPIGAFIAGFIGIEY